MRARLKPDFHVASIDRSHRGFAACATGRSARAALVGLARLDRGGPSPGLIGAYRDEVVVRGVCLGRGYVLGQSDGLWFEELADGGDALLSAAWDEAAAPGVDPPQPLWLAWGETAESGFTVQGFGQTPEASVSALVGAWVGDHAPMSGADPAYLASVARPRLRVVAIGLPGSAWLAGGPPPESIPASDPRFDGAFGPAGSP